MRRIVLTLVVGIFSCLTSFAIELDTTLTNYYVKLGAAGKGTSWDDALGEENFNYLLKHTKNGTTFHLAAGVYVGSYSATSAVTIIGGYSESPEKDETCNPLVNKTVFSTDVKGDNVDGDFTDTYRSDDYSTTLEIRLQSGSGDKVRVIGCGFEGGRHGRYGPGGAVCQIVGSSADFEKCYFSQCAQAFSLDRGSVSFSDCVFENNDNLNRWIMGNVCMTGCTFNNNDLVSINPAKSVYLNTFDEDLIRQVWVTNCTFKDNVSIIISGKPYSYCYYYNNTIVSKTGKMSVNSDDTYLTFIGNIVSVNHLTFKDAEESHFTSRYNAFEILDGDVTVPTTDKDILVNDNLKCLSDDLSNEGSFTSYLALSDNKLSDGKSLTYPLSESVVEGDQRYVKRNDPLCMGAYEYKGSGRVAAHRYEGVDTITVAEKYGPTGSYYSIGFHSDVKELVKSKDGKDSLIVHHQLFVKPDPAQKTFYVKKNGTGAGTSWDEAMGDTAFAIALFYAKDDVTFRIAEGVYHPILTDAGGFSSDYLYGSPIFYTTSNLIMEGGYSDKSTSKSEVRDPSKYSTVFSGDMNDDDMLSSSNMEDNLEICFEYEPKLSGSLSFDGIVFHGSKSSRANYGVFTSNNYSLTINQRNSISFTKCVFETGARSMLIQNLQSVMLKECFIRNYESLYSSIGLFLISSVSIENSTFVGCDLYFTVGKMKLTNSTVVNDSRFNSDQNNVSMSISGKESKTYDAVFTHNTLLGIVKFGSGNVSLTNNLFAYEITYDSYQSKPEIVLSNNVVKEDVMDSLAHNDIILKNDTNILVTEEDFLDILNNENGDFVVELGEKGFTPTVAVISDTLSDGRSILVPRTIEYDQRGIQRREHTSAGAFENLPVINNVDEHIDVPNLFTPDGNGLNDIFLKGEEVYIYDLHGRMICHSTDGWNGYYKGEIVDSGAYVYVLVTKSGAKQKGIVEIVK